MNIKIDSVQTYPSHSAGLRHVLQRSIRHLIQSYTAFYAYSSMKIMVAAWIGMIALPLYYYVWELLSPQPYDNMWVRLIGSGLCMLVVTLPLWPGWLRRFEMAVAYVTTVYCLPFFVSFMMLMTGVTSIWQLTAIASVPYMLFLFDAANAMVALVIGVAASTALFMMFGPEVIWAETLGPFLLVFFFLSMSFVLLFYGEKLTTRAKISAARALAGHVAHEIRTPLAAIRFEGEKLQELLGDAPDSASAQSPAASLRRINDQVNAAGLVIDMILARLNEKGPDGEGDVLSMAQTVETMLSRFHFKRRQQEQVHVSGDDFRYFGSEILMVHVLFNLLKNGLRAVAKKGSGHVDIILERGAASNRIIVRDTGTGIAKSDLPYLFVPFFTREQGGTGTGVGLSFCQQAVTRMGGRISCDSVEGEGATFTITLPNTP